MLNRFSLKAVGIAIAGLLLATGRASCASRDLLVVAPFQSGSISLYDLDKQTLLAKLPAEDGAGVVGIAVSARGVFVVDGNVQGRVRRFSAPTWKPDMEQEFRDRKLSLSAGPTVFLTGDNRLLIETYDAGAAAHGIRIFDTVSGRFAPIGLSVPRCAEPIFASSPGGSVAAVCPGFVSLFTSEDGSIAGGKEVAVPLRQPTAPIMSPKGDALFVLEHRSPDVPWQLTRVTTGSAPQAKSWPLEKILGEAAKENGGMAEPAMSGSVMAIDQSGQTLAVCSGSRAWLIDTATMRLLRKLQLPGAAAAAGFSGSGHTLYILQRDDAKHTMLLGRTEISSGETNQTVLLSELPQTPVVSQFAVVPTQDIP